MTSAGSSTGLLLLNLLFKILLKNAKIELLLTRFTPYSMRFWLFSCLKFTAAFHCSSAGYFQSEEFCNQIKEPEGHHITTVILRHICFRGEQNTDNI